MLTAACLRPTRTRTRSVGTTNGEGRGGGGGRGWAGCNLLELQGQVEALVAGTALEGKVRVRGEN